MRIAGISYQCLFGRRWSKASCRMVTVVALTLVGLTLGGCSNEPMATWHMINVTVGEEQGDAHLITVGDTKVMIDAGYYKQAEKVVLPYL